MAFRRGIAEVRKHYALWLVATTRRRIYLDACGNRITEDEYLDLLEEQLWEDYPEWQVGSW